jgi:hypothetical protein
MAACAVVAPLDGLTGGTLDAGGAADSAGAGDVSADATPADAPIAAEGGSPDAPDGLLDGPPDGAPDAPPDGPADSPPDGLLDGQPDSPPDAGPATGYCAALSPAPLFCADFDEGPAGAPLVPTPFFQVTGVGGTVGSTGAAFVSTPNAMRVAIAPNGPVIIDLAGYQKFQSQTAKSGTFTLGFDLRVDQADQTSSSDAVLGAIQFFDASGTYWTLQVEVYYQSASGELAVDVAENTIPGDGGPDHYRAHPFGAPLPLAAWTHVALQLVLPSGAGGPGTGTLTIGSTMAGSAAVQVDTVGGTPEVLVGGLYANQSASGWTMYYDDITFAAQ